jgi:uncharacterized membrane protein
MSNDVAGAGEQAKSAAEAAKQPAEKAVEQGASTITSELRSIGREAAVEALKALNPIAKQAAERAAQEVAALGPAMVRDYGSKLVGRATSTALGGVTGIARKGVGTATGAAGAAASAAGGLASKLVPGMRRRGREKATASGTGKGRRLPIQEWVDVGVPVENAYAQWTQFKNFPRYMFRTERIEQKDATHLEWHSKIWGVRRSWEAEITEQVPKERIVWKATSGANHVGIITFHPLAHNLTRVQVNLDFQPTGVLEKTASGLRATRRAVKSDLMRYKALIEMRKEPEGSWEGKVEEGEVVQEEKKAGEEQEAREQPAAEKPAERAAEEAPAGQPAPSAQEAAQQQPETPEAEKAQPTTAGGGGQPQQSQGEPSA